MFKLPIFDHLDGAQRVLIAGAGGGFDIFSGLPIYFALRNAGKDVFLANYTFSHVHPTQGERLTPDLYSVTYNTDGRQYFPEKYLSQWFHSVRGEEVTIYTFDRCGVTAMRNGYELLCRELNIDTIILVDGGTDSLLKGNEQDLGTPLEDMTSIASVNGLNVPRKYLSVLGFGIDTYHGVCHAHVLESIANQIKDGGYLGAISLMNAMPEVELFRAATNFVFQNMPDNVSIVSSSILSALQGEFGNHHSTKRTSGSVLFINPLMSLYWFFELSTIAKRVLYLDDLEKTERCEDVLAAIKKFRNNCGSLKMHKSIPL